MLDFFIVLDSHACTKTLSNPSKIDACLCKFRINSLCFGLNNPQVTQVQVQNVKEIIDHVE